MRKTPTMTAAVALAALSMSACSQPGGQTGGAKTLAAPATAAQAPQPAKPTTTATDEPLPPANPVAIGPASPDWATEDTDFGRSCLALLATDGKLYTSGRGHYDNPIAIADFKKGLESNSDNTLQWEEGQDDTQILHLTSADPVAQVTRRVNLEFRKATLRADGAGYRGCGPDIYYVSRMVQDGKEVKRGIDLAIATGVFVDMARDRSGVKTPAG